MYLGRLVTHPPQHTISERRGSMDRRGNSRTGWNARAKPVRRQPSAIRPLDQGLGLRTNWAAPSARPISMPCIAWRGPASAPDGGGAVSPGRHRPRGRERSCVRSAWSEASTRGPAATRRLPPSLGYRLAPCGPVRRRPDRRQCGAHQACKRRDRGAAGTAGAGSEHRRRGSIVLTGRCRRSASINTTAAGGNASLMTLA